MAASSYTSPGREIARIAIPVSLEFVVMLILNFVNQVIVGGLGSTAIAAVGFANSIVFIAILTLGAIGVSVSVLVARAFGAERHHQLSSTVTAAVLLSIAVSVPIAMLLALWPEQLLSTMGAEPAVASSGADYLRLTAISLPLTVVVAALSGVMRSMGHARGPLWATLIAGAVQTVLAWGLVFGHGPLPALGTAGAGWANLASAVLKLVALALLVYAVHRLATWDLPESRDEWRRVVGPLVYLALPIGLTELVWTSGTFLYNVVFARIGVDALAAAQITFALEGMFVIASIGLMVSVTALVGREIGRQDVPAAEDWIARILRISVVTSIISGLLYALTCFGLGVFYPETSDAVRAAAIAGILINAAAQVVKVRNMVLGGGVLPSGNDVRGVIIGDVVGPFVFGLPLAIILGLFTPLGLIGVFLARIVDEVVKLVIYGWRARRINWVALAHAVEGADDQAHHG